MKQFHQVVVGASLLASASAFAAITPATDTTVRDGEMFFTLYDDVAQTSYFLDLGVLSKDFRTLADLNRGTLTPVEGGSATSGAGQYGRSWAIDGSAGSEFGKFLAASSQANWRFAVAGADNYGGNPTGQRSLITTVTDGADYEGVTNNGSFNVAITAFSTMLDNGVVGQGDAANMDLSYAANGSVFGSGPNGLYQLQGGFWGNNGTGFLNFTTDNGWNERARMVYMTRSGSSNIQFTRTDIFDNDVGFGEFYIAENNGAYSVNYLISSVPEPGTYGLMLAGLVGLGLVARRRRG
jgi:hypothetical protein